MSMSVASSRNCGPATGADHVRSGHRAVAVLLLTALAVAASCTTDGLDRQDRGSRTVRIATPGRVLAIAPELTWSYYPAQAASYVFEGLTRNEEDGTLVPALARTWTASPDGRDYQFVIRHGVRFHDGTPLTAQDIVRAWSALLRISPDSLTHPWMLDGVDGAIEYALGEADNVAGLQARDDSTLDVHLVEPLAFFPTLLSHPQATIAAAASRPDRPIGTGPWRFVSMDSSAIRYAANDDYWFGHPLLDSLVYRYVPDSVTAEAFEAGRVDMAAELPMETRMEWSTRADIGFVESEAVAVTRLVINMRDSVFHDVRIRRALNHAVNAARLAQATAAASAVRAAGVIPPSLPGANLAREPYAFDPGLARRMLVAGGYPPDRPLRLWVPAPGLSDFPAEIGSLLRDYFEAVGLSVELTVKTEGIDTALPSGAADLVLTVWVGDYPDADAFLFPLYHSSVAGSAGNEGAYANPTVDRLIEASRHELDPGRRAFLLERADQMIFDEAPIVFLWFTRTATAYSLRLSGWGRDPQMSRHMLLHLASPRAD